MIFFEDIDGFSREFFVRKDGESCIMGIDYGTKNSGIAISTSNLSLAMPLFDVISQNIVQNIKSYDGIEYVRGIVIGLPKLKDGSGFHPFVKDILILADILQREFGVPILLWDERMSTVGAKRLRELDVQSRGAKHRPQKNVKVNSHAAQYILEGVLMFLRNN